MEKNEIDGKPAKKLKNIAKKPDQIILNPKTAEDNNSLHERVVELAQRRKRASLMRRIQAKLHRRKQLTATRLHSQQQLSQKSSSIAKTLLRKRLVGTQGAAYAHLSPSNKIQVDKVVDKKAILIRSMAKKLIPRLRSADVKRLQAVRSGGSVHGIQSYLSNRQLNMGDNFDLDHLVGMFEQITEKDIIALEAKASQHNIPEEVLEMVFLRGLYEGDKDRAFNRVNSFISLGEAAKLDADLEQKSKPEDRLDGTNSLAKVYKKETPGQTVEEDLRKWFNDKWVRMDTKGNIKGDCAREEGEGKPKCLPLAKASAMDKKDRASAARRKRREDPVADRSGKGNAPINVATEEASSSDLIKKSHSERGAPGTLKAKIKGPITFEKIRALKNKPGATTLDKKQANFYMNMHSEEYLDEANKPTNPSLWARAKTLARSKFDVYPSAYANGWAAKWYKSKGGGWKSVSEEAENLDELKSSTLTSYIDKVATGPSRGKTQSGLLKSIKAITGVSRAIRKRAENSMKEENESCCGDCGSVEEEFTPTGLEQYEDWGESIISEEEVGGRKVQLGKPFLTPGGPKKRSVYVKNDKGNVVKVNFGDTTGLTIKTDDPERRKAFRSRHSCDDPGPRHKARYWSCKAWSKGSVSAGLGGAGGS